MGANNIQIGGNHYQRGYQHWDFVCDAELHYLLGCASKYVSRWREKNGAQDLEKSIHYLKKAIEKGIVGTGNVKDTIKFANQHHPDDSVIITLIASGAYWKAIEDIDQLIEEEECGAGVGYVNQ